MNPTRIALIIALALLINVGLVALLGPLVLIALAAGTALFCWLGWASAHRYPPTDEG
jgi:hypothetical protein